MTKLEEIKALVEREIILLKAKKEINVTKRIDSAIAFLESIITAIDDPETKFDLSITADTHATVAVTKGGTSISAGKDVLTKDDVITVTATPASGYKLSKFTINGVSAESGDTVTVTGDIKIVVEAVKVYDLTVTATHTTVVAKVGGETITAGTGVLTSGDTLVITAEAEEGYELSTLTANGTDIESGDELEVSADVAIVASSTLIPVEPEEQGQE